MLIKWTFPFFFLPVIVCIVTALDAARRARVTAGRAVNIVGAGIITVAISALWYVPNYSQFRADIHSSTGIPASVQTRPARGQPLPPALWYLWSLLNNRLYLIPFLFFWLWELCTSLEGQGRWHKHPADPSA